MTMLITGIVAGILIGAGSTLAVLVTCCRDNQVPYSQPSKSSQHWLS